MILPKQIENKHTPSLADLLTEEQEAQLAQMLAEIIMHGWGTLEIEVIKGKVRFLRPRPSIRLKIQSKL